MTNRVRSTLKSYFSVADFGVAFSTRAKGEDLGGKIYASLANLNGGDTLVIDFNRVEAISYSFMDELLRTIMKDCLRKQIQKSIAVAGWSKDLFVVLDKSLLRRKCVLASPIDWHNPTERILRCTTTT